VKSARSHDPPDALLIEAPAITCCTAHRFAACSSAHRAYIASSSAGSVIEEQENSLVSTPPLFQPLLTASLPGNRDQPDALAVVAPAVALLKAAPLR